MGIGVLNPEVAAETDSQWIEQGIQDAELHANMTINWSLVSEAYPAIEQKGRERGAQMLGTVVVKNLVDVEAVPGAVIIQKTFHDTLTKANNGDEESNGIVDTCISTDIGERWFKAGHQSRVELTANQDTGELQQGEHSLTGISQNTLQHGNLNTVMTGRTVGEGGNAYIFGMLHQEGVLETHDVLVFSTMTADAETAEEFNFFQDSETVSVQLLSSNEEGSYWLDTALVAGKTAPDAESHAMDAINAVAQQHNVDLSSADEDTMLEYMILVPKGSLEDGIASVVETFDDAAGGTFYGEAKPRQNYGEYAQLCLDRDFSDTVSKVKAKVMEELPTMNSAEDAIRSLDYWAGKFSVDAAVLDDAIDPEVFGKAAAPLIRQARYQLSHGNDVAARLYVEQAKVYEESGSCPLKNRQRDSESSANGGQGSNNNESAPESIGEVSMTCPFCSEDTKGDPCSASGIRCTECDAFSGDSVADNKAKAAAYHESKRSGEHPDIDDDTLSIRALVKILEEDELSIDSVDSIDEPTETAYTLAV